MSADHQPTLFNHTLAPRLDREFAPLCCVLLPDQLESVKREISAHVEMVRQTLHQNEFIDIALAEQIAGRLNQLLDHYSMVSEPHQSLIVGAARYFVKNQDVESDLASLLGFDDDVQVLNHVLEMIGRKDLRIEL